MRRAKQFERNHEDGWRAVTGLRCERDGQDVCAQCGHPGPGLALADEVLCGTAGPVGRHRSLPVGRDRTGARRNIADTGRVALQWVRDAIAGRAPVFRRDRRSGARRAGRGATPVKRVSTGPTMARMNTYGVATVPTASIDVPTNPMMTSENSPRAISAVPARS